MEKWTDEILERACRKWKEDSQPEFGEEYEGCVPDLALSFLAVNPTVSLFLASKGVPSKFHQEYISDLLA